MINNYCPIAFSAFAIGLSACTSVPPQPVQSETVSVPEAFENVGIEFATLGPVSANWWQGFNDPILSSLVEKALSDNKDLAVAQANVETAQAVLRAQRLGTSFSTSANAGAELGRAARDGADTSLVASSGLSASWEYDAFGRIAGLIKSAELDFTRLNELRRDLAVTIASETALAYTDLRGNQVRLNVARANAGLQEDGLNLLKVLFDNGRATRLDLERAEAQYRTTLASLPLLEVNIKNAATRLGALAGQTDLEAFQHLADNGLNSAVIPSPPTQLAIGRPEELIRRRPDIRAAEAQIARQMALGEVERARLFPTIEFNTNLAALFDDTASLDNSIGFGIGPSIRWEGPDLRRVRADIEISDARTKVAFAEYERAVVQALSEVEVALTSFAKERSRRADLVAAAASAERAVELARLRFDEGIDDFLDVIDAQRTLLDAQDRLESSRLATTRQAISAYRALGGIWDDATFKDLPRSEDL